MERDIDLGARVVFDAAWRSTCSIQPVSVKALEQFVKAHYLQKRPAIVLLSLAMVCDTKYVGCIIYSAPPREADIRYGGKTWELARLYLLD